MEIADIWPGLPCRNLACRDLVAVDVEEAVRLAAGRLTGRVCESAEISV